MYFLTLRNKKISLNWNKINLGKHTFRRWEHQQGWWISEPLPWPGGPEAQQQLHPPEGTKQLVNPGHLNHEQ